MPMDWGETLDARRERAIRTLQERGPEPLADEASTSKALYEALETLEDDIMRGQPGLEGGGEQPTGGAESDGGDTTGGGDTTTKEALGIRRDKVPRVESQARRVESSAGEAEETVRRQLRLFDVPRGPWRRSLQWRS